MRPSCLVSCCVRQLFSAILLFLTGGECECVDDDGCLAGLLAQVESSNYRLYEVAVESIIVVSTDPTKPPLLQRWFKHFQTKLAALQQPNPDR